MCVRSGDDTFITTGYPIVFAACAARAALSQSTSRLGRTPYALSTCFDACSESASPGAAPARTRRAFVAAGDGSVGASVNGER